MPVFISLLRGVNVSGRKRMKMEDLRDLYTQLGFEDVRTLVQSGNVIFNTEHTDREALIERIENGIRKTFGFESRVFLRSAEEIAAIYENTPFTMEELTEPNKLLVMFLKTEPNTALLDDMLYHHRKTEVFTVRGCDLYISYGANISDSKFTTNYIEKYLSTVGTGRNWNTITKLYEMTQL